MGAPDWVSQGLALLGVSAPLVGIAGGVAWFVAKLTTDHKSKQWLQSHQGGLDQALETHKATLNLQIENAKAKIGNETDEARLLLKRQELLFEEEVVAAKEFIRLYYGIMPKQRFPGYDWGEAVRDIADDLFAVADRLDGYLAEFGVGISTDLRTCLEKCAWKAREGALDAAEETHGEMYTDRSYPSENVTKIVEEVIERLKDAFERVRKDLREGTLRGLAEGGDPRDDKTELSEGQRTES